MKDINHVFIKAHRSVSIIEIEYENNTISGIILNYSLGNNILFNKQENKDNEESSMIIDPQKITKVVLHGQPKPEVYYYKDGSWMIE